MSSEDFVHVRLERSLLNSTLAVSILGNSVSMLLAYVEKAAKVKWEILPYWWPIRFICILKLATELQSWRVANDIHVIGVLLPLEETKNAENGSHEQYRQLSGNNCRWTPNHLRMLSPTTWSWPRRKLRRPEKSLRKQRWSWSKIWIWSNPLKGKYGFDIIWVKNVQLWTHAWMTQSEIFAPCSS